MKLKKKNGFLKLFSQLSINQYLLIGIGVFAIGVFIDGGLQKISSFGSYCMIVAGISFLIAGLLILINKEVPRPGISSIKGIGAIITGIMIILVSIIIIIVLSVDLLL